ncbi:phage antirepressor N-terminal domain-containing protein [Klebsiella grimontii]|uniref:phage antirepressor N-terminal domain-containing protein n=1 Tax=Klebsiella grimontii TaxID=2058152 RepID=UPI0015E9ADE9|nr:phage antirepressor N-terminal domain-containing protein [Klebsiella grimontii]QLT09052.1 phage antirepressor N-terminal domain-containing protein [Klebsiella grimontii]
MSIAAKISTIKVPFHGDTLYLVNHEGEAQVPMRPVVEGMGLDWASQFTKIKQRFSTSIAMITMQLPGDKQRREVVCLNLRKLPGWLHTINVGKVRHDLREKVARYQEECDDVLYQYWTKGEVVNPRKVGRLSSATQLTPLRQTAERLIATGLGRIYPDIWKLVHKKFDIEHIHQLRPEQVFEAVEYLNALEGEYLGKANKQMTLPISYPMSYFEKYRWIIGDKALSAPWNYPAKMLTPNGDYPNPLGHMLGEMKRLGYEVDAALFQLLSLQHHLEVIRQKIDRIERAFH